MYRNQKKITLFWIIFMGHTEAEAGMKAVMQALAIKPEATDDVRNADKANREPNTKKRKERKKPKL